MIWYYLFWVISIQNLKLLLHECTFQYIQKFRFRYRFRPKQKYFFGLCIGFGQKEKWLFRLVSVSAEMKKSISVVPYLKTSYSSLNVNPCCLKNQQFFLRICNFWKLRSRLVMYVYFYLFIHYSLSNNMQYNNNCTI